MRKEQWNKSLQHHASFTISDSWMKCRVKWYNIKISISSYQSLSHWQICHKSLLSAKNIPSNVLSLAPKPRHTWQEHSEHALHSQQRKGWWSGCIISLSGMFCICKNIQWITKCTMNHPVGDGRGYSMHCMHLWTNSLDLCESVHVFHWICLFLA